MTLVLNNANILLVNSLRNLALKSASDFNAVKFFSDGGYAKTCLAKIAQDPGCRSSQPLPPRQTMRCSAPLRYKLRSWKPHHRSLPRLVRWHTASVLRQRRN